MISNWKKNVAGNWRGFIVYTSDDEEEEPTTEIHDHVSWTQWIASWFK
jgi:hypothetical protein